MSTDTPRIPSAMLHGITGTTTDVVHVAGGYLQRHPNAAIKIVCVLNLLVTIYGITRFIASQESLPARRSEQKIFRFAWHRLSRAGDQKQQKHFFFA